jgi:hypothetical protein
MGERRGTDVALIQLINKGLESPLLLDVVIELIKHASFWR